MQKRLLFFIAGICIFANQLSAEIIISPGSVSLTNFQSIGINFNNIANKSGFVNNSPFQSGVTAYADALLEEHRADLGLNDIESDVFGGQFPNSSSTPTGFGPGSIRFDLGSAHSLSGIGIWNVGNGVGMKDFQLRISDVENFSTFQQITFANNSNIQTASDFSTTGSNAKKTTTGEDFDFNSIYSGRYVELRIFDSHIGLTASTSVYVGEIAFSAVPEPGTFCLMSIALCLVHRRRRPIHKQVIVDKKQLV